MRLNNFFMCSIFLLITTISAKATDLSYIYGGEDNLYPLLIQTTDQGQSWLKKRLPTNSTGYISTGACGKDFCIAGIHESWPTFKILKTKNAGISWDQVNYYDTLELSDIWSIQRSACSNSMCVILSNWMHTAIVQSTDSANSWSIVYKDIQEHYYADVDCIDDYCVVVGNDGPYPLLIQTQDGGKTWEKISTRRNVEGKLSSVDCSSTFCAAVGFEGDGPYDEGTAIIFQSDDRGITWVQATVAQDTQPDYFYDVKCIDSNCIILGSWENNIGVIAENHGTESYQTTNVPKDYWLNGIDCNKTECFAIGWLFDETVKNLVWSNLGGNWHLVDIAKTATYGQLETVNCTETLCFASGYLFNPSTQIKNYFIIQNTEGSKWNSVKLGNITFQAIGSLDGGVAGVK